METQSALFPRRSLLPWTPAVVAALCSYGPVGYNYGFALYFLTYRHGFVKRGLVGTLFSGVTYFTRAELLLTEYLFLAAAFALCLWVFRRVLFRDTQASLVTVLLLSAPGTLPHIAYLFAQPDVTLFLLLLVCMALFLFATPTVAALCSLPLCCVALLAHEAFSLMFYPLILVLLLELCRSGRLRWALGVAHAVLVSSVFLAILHFGKLKVTPATILAEAQSRTSVGIQSQVYEVMASTLGEQWQLVHRMYTPGVWRWLVFTVLFCAPYFLLLARLLRRSMHAVGMPWWQRIATSLLLLSPLVLCLLGHDFTRWMGAACIDASFFLLYLLQTSDAAGRVLRQWVGSGERVYAWLAYVVAVGPMGATGVRSAEMFVAAFYGR